MNMQAGASIPQVPVALTFNDDIYHRTGNLDRSEKLCAEFVILQGVILMMQSPRRPRKEEVLDGSMNLLELQALRHTLLEAGGR